MTLNPLVNPEIHLIKYTPVFDLTTVRWLNAPDLRKSFGLTYRVTLASHRRWMKQNKAVLARGIIDAEGQHLGNVFVHANERHRSAYLQIYLGNPSSRGQGVGSVALVKVLTLLFFRKKFHRVWLHTLIQNTRAEHFYEKHGFVSEGIEREALSRSGHYESQRRWSILAPEWKRRVASLRI